MNVSDRNIQVYLKSQLQHSLWTDSTSLHRPPGTENSAGHFAPSSQGPRDHLLGARSVQVGEGRAEGQTWATLGRESGAESD